MSMVTYQNSMKKTFLFIIGTLLILPLHISEALGIGIDQFKDTVYRPENLPATKATSGGVEMRLSEIIQYAINLVLYASGSVAVLFLIIGGIRYITSFGNQEGMDAAKKTIKFALIGLVAVILSYAIVTNIIDLIYKATT
jgi:hypothetical protein